MADQEAPYSNEDRERWKQALLAKGREVASKLEEILAGKNVTLSTMKLPWEEKPGERKEERLRRFLDHLMKRMRSVQHPRFGYDPERGAFLSVPELDEMPWIDVEP